MLAVGGDHVSNDLACGLKVPLSKAEDLKIKHGAAIVEPADQGQTVTANAELGCLKKRSASRTFARSCRSGSKKFLS